MDSMDKIDAALDSVLKAGNMSLRYESSQTIDRMRLAMRKIMVESYAEGSRAGCNSMNRAMHTTGNHPRLGRDNNGSN